MNKTAGSMPQHTAKRYEVDFSADGLSMSLAQRYKRWKTLKQEMESEMQRISASPLALGQNSPDGGHYFFAGMNDNHRAQAVPGRFWEV